MFPLSRQRKTWLLAILKCKVLNAMMCTCEIYSMELFNGLLLQTKTQGWYMYVQVPVACMVKDTQG